MSNRYGTRQSVKSKKDALSGTDKKEELIATSQEKTIMGLSDNEGEQDTPTTNEKIYQSILEVHKKLDKITSDYNDIDNRVTIVAEQADDNTERLAKLEEENRQLKSDMAIMLGLLQKQSCEIIDLRGKVDDQVARSMSQNIIFHGLEITGENPDYRQIVKDFMENENILGLTEIDKKDIFVAHKMGEAVIAKVAYPLKEKVFKNKSKLQNKKNSQNNDIYITDQQPESIRAARRDAYAIADDHKERNKKLPDNQKAKVEVRRTKVYVNNNLIKNPVPAPQPIDLVSLEKDEQRQIDKVKLNETARQGEQGSSFLGISIRVSNIVEVRRAYKAVRQKYSSATHVMLAYTFKDKNISTGLQYGKQDDGEYGGSFKILRQSKRRTDRT